MPAILIVDDSALQRSIIRKLLQPLGATVTESGNGQEALEALNQNTFQCVITDLLMPVMDGFEFLKLMKERYPVVPVVVLTADIQETTRKKAMELGATGFVNKPVGGTELSDAVTRALRS